MAETDTNTSRNADDIKGEPAKGVEAKHDAPARTAHTDATQRAAEAGRVQARQAIEEASRITAENAGASIRTAREIADQSIEAGRKLFDAWSAGTEAALKSAFDLQNAALSTSMTYIEARNKAGREVVERWSDAARSAQRATLEAWQTTARVARSFDTFAE